MKFTLTIKDSGLERPEQEVGFIRRAVETAMNEFGRSNGNQSSGDIIGQDSKGRPNVSLGSWRFHP
jgi:hypothetical protein